MDRAGLGGNVLTQDRRGMVLYENRMMLNGGFVGVEVYELAACAF